MRRVCTGTRVHYARRVRGRMARPGRRMRRVCADTLLHYEQTTGERVASRPGRNEWPVGRKRIAASVHEPVWSLAQTVRDREPIPTGVSSRSASSSSMNEGLVVIVRHIVNRAQNPRLLS